MALPVAWAVASLLLPSVAEAQTKLVGHSLGGSPDINSLGTNWFLAGTVIPTTKSMVLTPGVPTRLGLMWNRFPLLTNDFEAKFSFTAKSPATRSTRDEGFAFWYVQENVSQVQEKVASEHMHNQEELIANTWNTAFTAEKFDLFGYRSQFDGLGVFFCEGSVGEAKDGVLQPTVTSIAGDGTKPYRLHLGIPATDALKVDYRTGQEVKVTIRVQPTEAKISIEGQGDYTVKSAFRPGGFIGFTAYGGQKGAVAAQERSDFVELWNLEVNNYDKASKGEDMPEVKAAEKPKAGDDKENIVQATSSFKDHRAESEAIKELTNMVFKLVVESQPARQQMARAIETLGKRITVMEKSFDNLKNELDKKTGHKLGAEFDAIKKELTSLSMVASTETQERHKKLDSLHEDIQDVHKTASSPVDLDKHLTKLTQSNQRTLESLTNEHQKMFGVSIAAIAFIIIAGLSLYNKFRCWEKKHIL